MEAGRPAYKLSSGRRAVLPLHDALVHEKWLAVAHLDAGNHEGKIFLAAPVATEDLLDLAVEEEVVMWDTKEGHLVAQTQKHISGLVLGSKPLRNIPQERTLPVLLEAVRSDPSLLSWPEHFDQWQARILSLRIWRPLDGWPDVRMVTLLAQLDEWLAPALTQVRSRNDLQRIKVMDHLLALLPWPLPQKLDELAPSHLTVPTGSQIRLQYHDDGAPPVLAVRLQEMFGQLQTPTVNEGRNKVLLHLLSPAYRPVQVTQDLHSFWQNTYHEVRKDLRGRYPKHHWPEDPWTAEAVRGVKRKGS
jgi:ATP-dependent helicase HrpB